MNFRLLFSLITACATLSHVHAVSYYTPQELHELGKQNEYKKGSVIQQRVEVAVKIAIVVFIIMQLYKIDLETALKNLPRSMKDLADLHIFLHTKTPFFKIEPLKFIMPYEDN